MMESQSLAPPSNASFCEVKGPVSVAECAERPLRWVHRWCCNSPARPFALEFYIDEADALDRFSVPVFTVMLIDCTAKLVKLSGVSSASETIVPSPTTLSPHPQTGSSQVQQAELLTVDNQQTQKLAFELRTYGSSPSARYVSPDAEISAHWMQNFRQLLSQRPAPSQTLHAPRLSAHARSTSNPNLIQTLSSDSSSSESLASKRTSSVHYLTVSAPSTHKLPVSTTPTGTSLSFGRNISAPTLGEGCNEKTLEVILSPTILRRQRISDDRHHKRAASMQVTTEGGASAKLGHSPTMHELLSPVTPKSLTSSSLLSEGRPVIKQGSLSQPPSPSELSPSFATQLQQTLQPQQQTQREQQNPRKVRVISTATSRSATSQGLRKMPRALIQHPLDMLVTVDLSCNMLTMFPEELSQAPHLQDLNLNCNRLPALPGTALRKFLSLKNLQVSRNFIRVLPYELFHLPALTHFSAHHCYIWEIEPPRPSAYEQPSHLRVVNLCNNRIRSLPDEMFIQAPDIDNIDLSENFITTLPATINRLSHLTELRVNHNSLIDLPHCLTSLKSLEVLDAADNMIREIPKEWLASIPDGGFPALRQFILQKNDLRELPEQFFSLFVTKCEMVDISENRLTKIPSLDCVPRLEALFAGGNALTDLPSLPTEKLSYLDVSRNQLRALPDVSQMKELEILHAGHNPLEAPLVSIPPKLTELVVPCCNLKALPRCEQRLQQLQILIASGNELEEIPDEYVGSALHLCDLSFNHFKSFPSSLTNHKVIKMPQLQNPPQQQQQQQQQQQHNISVMMEGNQFDSKEYETSKRSDQVVWDPSKFQASLRVGSSESKGRRPLMEDARIAVGDFSAGHARYDLLGLFDGHGGADYSRTVAELFPEHFSAMSCFMSDDGTSIQELLEETLHGTDESAYAKVKDDAQGTTALVALFTRPSKDDKPGMLHLHISNVGDSRAVLCRRGRAIRLSEDQKPLEPAEYMRLTDLGATVTDRGRVQGLLAVSRALGDRMLHPYVSGAPTYQKVIIEPDDEFLILACDGVWDVLTDAKAVQVVRDALAETQSPDLAAMALRDWAFCSGSTDNITAIVVQLNCIPPPSPPQPVKPTVTTTVTITES